MVLQASCPIYSLQKTMGQRLLKRAMKKIISNTLVLSEVFYSQSKAHLVQLLADRCSLSASLYITVTHFAQDGIYILYTYLLHNVICIRQTGLHRGTGSKLYLRLKTKRNSTGIVSSTNDGSQQEISTLETRLWSHHQHKNPTGLLWNRIAQLWTP